MPFVHRAHWRPLIIYTETFEGRAKVIRTLSSNNEMHNLLNRNYTVYTLYYNINDEPTYEILVLSVIQVRCRGLRREFHAHGRRYKT